MKLFVSILCTLAGAMTLAGLVRSPEGAATSQPATSQPASRPADTQPATERVAIAGESFDLELATTPAQRDKGLSGRTEIAAQGGMLFVFPRPQAMTFWMVDCPIPMDLLILNSRGTIIALHRMQVEPPQGKTESREAYLARLKRYGSRAHGRYAIELKSGTADRLKLKVGDPIPLDLAKLAKLGK
jgi:uncharacterized protein